MDKDKNQLKGKTVVITGVSSGFGLGSTLGLTELGANVVGISRRADLLEDLRNHIENKGGSFRYVAGDVSKSETIEELSTTALKELGAIDIWINNVGVGALGYFWDIPLKDHERLIDVNLKGVVYGAHAAIGHFVATGEGTLINVGSIGSEVPLALQNTYSATKAGVLSLGRSINRELEFCEKENIKVATIIPWAVDTPWWEHAANYTGHKPCMAAMDGPELVIDEILNACIDPNEKMPVGYKAEGSNLFHRIFPN
ncbi:hypothetical protein I215_09361 [Galbibacter marinus]|uniref:Short-chain dehydrogenase/reductase SDR n=1 Tax=Galbibacter marinus TaxID=555500 RepID=K2PU05_9FLAO|nr:SDR family NAD(P)-dependent oxidoreductase [Galbibacter marinus]EKF55059.1 hypothetical protein I215_09361 [Galbibacter marinus]